MIKVFKGTDTNYTTNGEKIIQPIGAVITKNKEEEYLEVEAPLKYAEFLIQDNVLLVDTLSGKKGYKIHNPITSNTVIVKAWLCYQEQIMPPADRGAVIAHGKNLANCAIEENWDDVVTNLTPIGYNGARLPEGNISVPTPYQRVYSKTIEFDLTEALESDVETLEDEVDTNSSLVASFENTVTILTNKVPTFDATIASLQGDINIQQQRLTELKAIPSPTETQLKEIATIEAMLPLLNNEIASLTTSKTETEAALTQAQQELATAKTSLETSKSALNTVIIGDLRSQAQAYLNLNQYPQINYDLEAHLDGIIEIGDTVRVKHPDMRVDLLTKVTEYKLDCLTLRFVQVQFGTSKVTLKGKISEVDQKIDKIETGTEKLSQSITKYSSEYRRDDKELVSKFVSELYGVSNGVYGLLERNMSLFRQTASEISATVSRTNADLSKNIASLSVRADEINAEVSRVNTDLSTQIASLSITADKIRTEVSSNYTDLDGKITSNTSLISQTATAIRSEVSTSINGVNQSISAVEQTANKISWLVKSGTSESNFLLTDRAISQVADTINLDGYVQFTNLSQVNTATVINGGNITAGTLDCSKITVKNLNINDVWYGEYPVIDCSGSTSNPNIYIGRGGASGYVRPSSISMRASTINIGETNSLLYKIIFTSGSIAFVNSSLGFYGATPAAKQTVDKVYTSSVSLEDLATRLNRLLIALNTLGLINASNFA
jgi:predicted  nucleic acid-binding Zn-ribbon protein